MSDQYGFQVGDLVQVQRKNGSIVLARITWIEQPKGGKYTSGQFPRLSLSLFTSINSVGEQQRAVVYGQPDSVIVINQDPPELFNNESIPAAHARMLSTIRNEGRRLKNYDHQSNLSYFLNMFDDSRIPEWIRRTVTFGDTPQTISYTTDPRYVDTWRRRRKVKPATFISAMDRAFSLNMNKGLINDMAYAYGIAIPDPSQFSFEIVSGSDITSYYRNSNVHTCMSGGRNTNLYAVNPNKVRMLVINRLGKYHGRALIWNTDEGRICLDRIYPSDGGYHIELARQYAESNGWDTLPVQSYGQSFASGNHYSVTLDADPQGRFPYMDTFRYVQSPERKRQFTLHTKHRIGYLTLDHTNGTYDGMSYGAGYDGGYDDDNDDDDMEDNFEDENG